MGTLRLVALHTASSPIMRNVLVLFLVSSTLGRQCPDGKIRGVNLGGWLVLEEWMLPQLFQEFHQQYNGDIHDEWTLAENVAQPDYRKPTIK